MFTFATVGVLVACAADTDSDAARKKPSTRPDAAVSSPPDAAADAGSSGGGGGGGGTVSCYTEGAPSNTCTLPTHCCFTNYSAQHNGSCSNDSCPWGTIDCDGPEDCGSGGHCCATQLTDSDGIAGWRLACQASACGAPPTSEELCHISATCGGGASCVTAYGRNNDLPRSLSICR